MMARRAVLGLFASAAALLLCGCERTDTLRYRMTVEVETPTGVRSGSSVIETTITKGPRTGQGSGITSKMRGEAVAVDLGSGQTLFALLNGDRQAASDYHGNLLGNALRAGGKSDPPMPRSFTSQEWSEERAAARSIRPTIVLPPPVYPKLVRFVDMDNSATVRAVDSRDLSSSFGPGIRLRRITASVTDDPVTYTLKSRLKWLGDYPEPSLKPGHALDDRSLAAVIHHGDFIQR